MLRIEARNSAIPIERKPPWIKIQPRIGAEFAELKSLVNRKGLHTVCEAARLPKHL